MRRGFLAALLLVWAALASAQALRAWSGGTAPPLELQDLDGAAHRLAAVVGEAVRAPGEILERERRRRAAVPALEIRRAHCKGGGREQRGDKKLQTLISREVIV